VNQKNSKRKILFVCHIASMSGAPLLLLEIIEAFKNKSPIPFSILIIKDGPLYNQFSTLGKTYRWHLKINEPAGLLRNRVRNLITRGVQKIYRIYILFRLRKVSLVFLNTMATGRIQKKLLFLRCKFICYVHELESSIHIVSDKEKLKTIVDNTSLFIACSGAVKQNLVSNHNIKNENVKVFNTAITKVIRDKNEYGHFVSSFKDEYKIPADAVIIGSAGTNEWRKGFDLFLPLVTVYFNLFPHSNVYFVWKGFNEQSANSYFDLYDYWRHKANNRIILLPHDDKGISTIACMDLHLLLSREDPYPLVVLEAASFAIPTICFSDSGGAVEFIEEDAGYSVPYGDLIKMAQKINEMATDNKSRIKIGIMAQQKLVLRHAQEKTMPEFINLLETV
jgi:glycosyltransferase involved in cell wall biosynthesis